MIGKLLFCIFLTPLGAKADGLRDVEPHSPFELSAVLKRAVANQLENDRARYRYIYEEKEVVDRFAGAGAIEKSVTRTYTWIHTEFRSFSKLIAVNGARYDRRYLETQDEVIRRSIAADERLSPGRKQARRDETRREREREMQAAIFRNLWDAFRFFFLREERVNGSETLVLDYEPKTGFKPPSSRSAFLLSLRGKLWVTRKSHQPIRLTGTLGQDVKYVGGIFGRLKKGATITLEQADIGNGLWLPTFSTVTYEQSLFFKGSRRRVTSLYRNYRLNPSYRRTGSIRVESLD